MSEQTNSVSPEKPVSFLIRPQIALALGGLVVLTAVAVVVVLLNFRPESPKPAEEPLSIAELRDKANQKLASLTNGVALSTLESAVGAVSDKNPTSSPSKHAPWSSSNRVVTMVDPEKTKEIVVYKQIKDDVVFYTETEIRYFQKPQKGQMPYPNQDWSKPVVYKNWISANYTKSVIYHDNQITNLYLGTPRYSLHYSGGKYALKKVYTQDKYFQGLSFGYNNQYLPRNLELEFLKYLLDENNQFTDLGIKVVDGRNFRVIQVNYDPFDKTVYSVSGAGCLTLPADFSEESTNTTEEIGTRYYIDQNTMTLYLTEDVVGDKVTMSSKNLASQTYTNPVLEDIFNINEIAGVPVREITLKLPEPEDFRLTSFIKDFDLFYFDKLNSNRLSAKNYSKLATYYGYAHDESPYSDPEFNPSITPEYLDNLAKQQANYISPVASYTQETINVSIYNTKPNHQEYLQNYTKLVNDKRVTVKLEGVNKPVEGRYFEVTQNYQSSKCGEQVHSDAVPPAFLELEFQYQKWWYVLITSIYLENSALPLVQVDTVELQKLSPAKAKEIDDQRASQSGGAMSPRG